MLVVFWITRTFCVERKVCFRNSACKMVRTLIQLMRTLDKMPEEVKLSIVPKKHGFMFIDI